MNIITLTLVVAAIWTLFLACVATVATASHTAGESRLVGSVAAGGVFVATAITMLTIAWMR